MKAAQEEREKKHMINFLNSFKSASPDSKPFLTPSKPINTVSPLRSDLDLIYSYNNKSPETSKQQNSKSPNSSTSSLLNSSMSSTSSLSSTNSRFKDDKRLCKF